METVAQALPSAAPPILRDIENEISIVMPCLNEADTLEACISKAQRAIREHAISAEIIVADNGSTDGSIAIAERLGARVVNVRERGYGNALMGGIAAARGKYILMGDADDSYDFGDAPRFLKALREGNDLVQGCRLPAGGGTVKPGAMPFLHRWLGNPLFTQMVRTMFDAPIHDVYCGMRAFTKEHYQRLNLRCTGMEFATEMVIRSAMIKARIAEIPITLHPDGRKSHPPHLKTFRDGWRTLRFLLLYSPKWLFFTPGLALMLIGAIGYALAIPGVRVGRATLDAHTLLVSTLFILVGYQAVIFAVSTAVFGTRAGLLPESERLNKGFEFFTIERGIFLGLAMSGIGIALLLFAVYQWWAVDFGRLDYAKTMRWVIPGTLFTALGAQTVFSSFFISILGMKRR
ncbi:MAG TPA: glycosyltransferase family 2 protein [Planctomycetota bacterium]|nr:glycosyltransferase family 2 protein [Planctomycetota bacterium]